MVNPINIGAQGIDSRYDAIAGDIEDLSVGEEDSVVAPGGSVAYTERRGSQGYERTPGPGYRMGEAVAQIGRDSLVELGSEDGVSVTTSRTVSEAGSILSRGISLYGAAGASERWLTGHKRGVWRLLPLSSEKVLSCSYDKTAKVWDLYSQKCIHTLANHPGEVLCAETVGETLLTGCGKGVLNMWNKTDFSHTGTIQDPKKQGFYSLLRLGGGRVASGTCQQPDDHKGAWDHDIKIWNVELNQLVGSCKGHKGGIPKMVKLEDAYIVSCSADKTVRIWDTETQECKGSIEAHKSYIYSMCIVGSLIITGGRDRYLHAWDKETLAPAGSFVSGREGYAHGSTIYDICQVSKHVFASASRDGLVKLWDVRTGRVIKALDVDDGFVYSLVAPTGDCIVAGTAGRQPPNPKAKPVPSLAAWKFKEE